MINTTRCLIRRFQPQDLPAFAAYRNNAHWMRYQLFKNLSDEEYRAALLNQNTLADGVQLAVTDNRNGELLGDLYVKRMDDGYCLGYTIAPEHARKGYAFEAVLGLVGWLKTEYAAQRITAASEPENTPSIRLLEKLGFVFSHFDAPNNENVYHLHLR